MHGHGKAWLVAMRHALGEHVETCGICPCRQAMTLVIRPCARGRPMVGRRGHTPFLELESKLSTGLCNDIERQERTRF